MKLKRVIRFFDVIEDRVHALLARHPVLYAMIGSIGIILLWRGIWGLADEYHMSNGLSIVIGTAILLATGLFVSFFVGEGIIISGINE
jgi:low affinity Fe/Cu permease